MTKFLQHCSRHVEIGFSYHCHACLAASVKSMSLTITEMQKELNDERRELSKKIEEIQRQLGAVDTRTTGLNRIGENPPFLKENLEAFINEVWDGSRIKATGNPKEPKNDL